MTQPARKQTYNTENSLVLTRIVDAPREKLFKLWTSPESYKDWFCPRPWKTVKAEAEFVPGGIFNAVMESPEGQRMEEDPGCVLEVVENEKLVWTNAMGPGFQPKEKPFMTAIITFEDAGGGKTRYTATCLHP